MPTTIIDGESDPTAAAASAARLLGDAISHWKREAMTMTLHRSTLIRIPRVANDPIWMFTPEGERTWATDGWDPHYPEPARTDGVGTVFTTDHGDGPKVWIIVDRTETTIRYAGVTPTEAGTLNVAVEGDLPPVGEDITVSVTYELTALSFDGEQSLAAFDERYEEEIATWQRDIRAAFASGALRRVVT